MQPNIKHRRFATSSKKFKRSKNDQKMTENELTAVQKSKQPLQLVITTYSYDGRPKLMQHAKLTRLSIILNLVCRPDQTGSTMIELVILEPPFVVYWRTN